jgi:hypothetical protein
MTISGSQDLILWAAGADPSLNPFVWPATSSQRRACLGPCVVHSVSVGRDSIVYGTPEAKVNTQAKDSVKRTQKRYSSNSGRVPRKIVVAVLAQEALVWNFHIHIGKDVDTDHGVLVVLVGVAPGQWLHLHPHLRLRLHLYWDFLLDPKWSDRAYHLLVAVFALNSA